MEKARSSALSARWPLLEATAPRERFPAMKWRSLGLLGGSGAIVMACAAPSAPPPPLGQARLEPASDAGARVCRPWTPHAPADADGGAPETPITSASSDPDPSASDRCAVSDSNLASAEKAILTGAAGPKVAPQPWDHQRPPEFLARIDKRLVLTKRERTLLGANGFVVLDRVTYDSFAWGLHDVYQSQLPLFVSADAILHAVYASNDNLIADVERQHLEPLLGETLAALHCSLLERESAYPPDVARDLDLYLTVARSLLEDAPVAGVLGEDPRAAALVKGAKDAAGPAEIDVFGRLRKVDWSSYQPRGHYTGDRAPFFRSAMWLSRMELNLVSRSSRSSAATPLADPRETPHEAIVALALADLADHAGALPKIAELDHAWAVFAGRREDVSVADLVALREQAHLTKIDEAAFEPLKRAIGDRFPRTARIFPMPQGTTTLPVVSTLLGPRIVADTAALRDVLEPDVPDRHLVGAGDVGYLLGLDRAKRYLADDLATFPELSSQLDVARRTVANAPRGEDLYGAWLTAVRGVAAKRDGVLPSFESRAEYDDLRLDSLITGYGQIRHNYVLVAGQSYDLGGCEIPDAYVDPMPAMYDSIADYAARGNSAFPAASAYFTKLGTLAKILSTISRHELEGRALSGEEKRFLGMVAEMTPGGTGGPPTYSGWYFDMFRGRENEALASAAFTADYHTSTYESKVVYAGAESPRLGLFVVDTGGAPRVMAGPVAKGYELVGPLGPRYDDTTGAQAKGHRAPWSASYTAAAPPTPGFALTVYKMMEPKWDLTMRASETQHHLIIDALDHHGEPVDRIVVDVPAGARKKMTWTPRSKDAIGVRVTIGEFSMGEVLEGPGDGVELKAGDVTLDEP